MPNTAIIGAGPVQFDKALGGRMNIDEVNGLIVDTEKALQTADECLRKLANLPNPPHSLLIEPTIKLRDRILKDLDELSDIKANLAS